MTSAVNCYWIRSILQDFKGLSVDKLEKYFLVLAALDENLSEYKDIKNDLEQVKHRSLPGKNVILV